MSDKNDERPSDPWTDDSYLDNPAPNAKESGMTDKNVDNKTWKLLEKAVLASVTEQRRTRRWGIFFKTLTFAYLAAMLFFFSPFGDSKHSTSTGAHTALIEVRGMIADQETASADSIVSALRSAFEDKNTKGIVLRINSPGVSPVQSA